MSSRSPHIEIYAERYLDKNWEEHVSGGYVYKWRWRFRSGNGKILSESSKAYNDPRDLVRGLELSHPGYRMRDAARGLDTFGGWCLWRLDTSHAIRVRVPDGTVKLWRSRRNR